MLLSDRMRAVVGLVEPCDCIADIGCDHGYVAMELIRDRICKRVIAMDINYGPLELAKSNIKEYGLQEYIETRISDGTAALTANDNVDGIICAGMGGKLIIHILTEGMHLVKNMKQLILQPQSEIDEVRSFIRNQGFSIEKEDMICDDGKYYPMMRIVPDTYGKQEMQMAEHLGQKVKLAHLSTEDGAIPPEIAKSLQEESEKMTRIQDEYGPYLLKTGHPILREYLLWQKENLENIQSNLKNQKQPTARQQYRIMELDEALSDIVFCLYRFYS